MIDNSSADIFGMVPAVPSFQLFQPVRSHYITDELQVMDDLGVIVGVFYMPDRVSQGYKPGWCYLVMWTHLPSSLWLSTPYIETTTQDDLRSAESDPR